VIIKRWAPKRHGKRIDLLSSLLLFTVSLYGIVFVAEASKEAKKKGLATLLHGALHQHKDNLKEVDDCILLEKIGDKYIHLTPPGEGEPFSAGMAGIPAYWSVKDRGSSQRKPCLF